jgi:hypothetical protein
MPSGFISLLHQRCTTAITAADPQRASVARRHQRILKSIATADTRYVRTSLRKADESARQQVGEAANWAHADLQTLLLSNSWLQAVLDEHAAAASATTDSSNNSNSSGSRSCE